jgi:hypothetical protein
MNAPAPRPPITDSPWFWVYLFATAALAALALVAPKFEVRQAQVERSIQGRQRAVQSLSSEAPSVPVSQPGDTRLTLQPLFLVMAAAAIIGWIVVWRRHWRAPGKPPGEPTSKSDSS